MKRSSKLSPLQFLLLRPVIAEEKKSAPTADKYIATIREFEHYLRFAGWSRKEAVRDAKLGVRR